MSTERPATPAMTNPRADRVRAVARLAGRSARLKRRQFLVEGPQAVREALIRHGGLLDTGEDGIVVDVFASEQCLARLPELATLAARAPLRIADDAVLSAMADTVNPQGIIAVCRFTDVSLDAVLDAGPSLIAVLTRLQDPGNAGTVLRAADAAGADAVVVTASSVDIFNPKALRSTAGSLFHLPVVTGVEASDLAARLRAAGVAILAADGYGDLDLDALQDRSAAARLSGLVAADAGADVADGGAQTGPGGQTDAGQTDGGQPDTGRADLGARHAWLFGNEAQGLDEHELSLADHRIRVPIYGQAESLNVGTAATVCLYASARAQRRQ